MMAGKLTEEQRQEVVIAYQEGVSAYALSRRYGVTDAAIYSLLRNRGIDRRPWPVRALSEGQKEEIVRRYKEGERSTDLAVAFGISASLCREIICEAGATRKRLERAITRQGNVGLAETAQMSQQALYQVYAGPGSGYPAVCHLAKRFGISETAMKTRLRANGIKIRTQGEQESIDIKQGRRKPPVGRGGHRWSSAEVRDMNLGRRMSARHRARIASAKRTARVVPCWWCGSETVKNLCNLRRNRRSFCSHQCSGKARWFPTENPRPLIVDLLCALLQEEPYKALPRRIDTLEKAGEPIGATDAEYAEIMAEWATS